MRIRVHDVDVAIAVHVTKIRAEVITAYNRLRQRSDIGVSVIRAEIIADAIACGARFSPRHLVPADAMAVAPPVARSVARVMLGEGRDGRQGDRGGADRQGNSFHGLGTPTDLSGCGKNGGRRRGLPVSSF